MSSVALRERVEELRRRFDPNQLRDRHGRWTDGMPEAIIERTFRMLGGDLGFEAFPGDNLDEGAYRNRAYIQVTDPDGIWFQIHDGRPFADGIGDIRDLPIGAGPEFRRADNDEPLYAFERVGRDEFRLTIPNGEGESDLADREDGIRMTGKQFEALADTADAALAARRVETDGGEVDFYPTSDGNVGVRVEGQRGKEPTDLSFAEKDWEKLWSAVNLVYEGFDENDPNEDAPVINEVRVRTKLGELVVLGLNRGPDKNGLPGDPETFTISPVDSDAWHITWSSAGKPMFEHPIWDSVEAVTDNIGRSEVSRMLLGDAGDTRTGPSGTTGPKGGQFAPGGGRVTGKGKKPANRRPAGKPAAKPGPPKPLSFDGKRGTGYGIKGGDPRVRTLQSVLNRFGLTDSQGRALAVDGKYGPLTTSAVKKLQRAMGVEATGVVDDAFLKRVSSAKSLSELRPPKRPRARRPVRQGYRSQLPGFMDPGDADSFGQGFEDVDTSPPTDRHVLDNGICVTCKMREQMSEPHVFDNGVCTTCESARSVQALVDALDEVFRTRYVRTPAGAKKYGLPIGSPIGGSSGPHVPKPHTPGKKGTLKDRLVAAITEHLDGKGDGKPLAGFNREQLRQAAKSRGIKLDRGEHEDSIAEKLIAHARGDHNDRPTPKPEPAKPPVKKVAPAKATPKPEPAKKVAPAAKPATPKPVEAKPSSPKIAKLQDDLAKIREEALPIAQASAKWMEGHKIDLAPEWRREDQLKALRKRADKPTKDLLDALIDRDGSPFGGDSDTDADRWVTPPAWDVTSRREGFPPAGAKTRDLYVVKDANTITQNASLRTGDPTPAAKRWSSQVRTMVRATALNNDSKLHRGAAMTPEQIVALRPGAVIHDLGFNSTDVDPKQADFYARTRLDRTPGTIKVLYEIRVPKGTPASNVGVGEVVLDRGNRYRVVSSRMGEGFTNVVETERGPVVHVVLEYAGGDP